MLLHFSRQLLQQHEQQVLFFLLFIRLLQIDFTANMTIKKRRTETIIVPILTSLIFIQELIQPPENERVTALSEACLDRSYFF